MNTAAALFTGYRGSKAHAVDTAEPRNQGVERTGEGMSLCGWRVSVGEVEFRDMGCITCRTCAKAAG